MNDCLCGTSKKYLEEILYILLAANYLHMMDSGDEYEGYTRSELTKAICESNGDLGPVRDELFTDVLSFMKDMNLIKYNVGSDRRIRCTIIEY